jgi:Laminin G domain
VAFVRGQCFTLRRWALIGAALIFGTAFAGVGSASAATTVAAWEMNEPSGATTMLDGSGSNLSGTIGSAVVTGVVTDGATGYRWLATNTSGVHPERLVKVDSSSLNPGTEDFTVIVRFYTASFGDKNIIQKGQSHTAGGMWKIAIKDGKVNCNFKGSVQQSALWSREIIADSTWHTVRCDRRSTGVTITVDGGTPRTNSKWTGNIANTWPVSIGGKPKCNPPNVGCDYFVGRVDRVVVERP